MCVTEVRQGKRGQRMKTKRTKRRRIDGKTVSSELRSKGGGPATVTPAQLLAVFDSVTVAVVAYQKENGAKG